MALQVLVRPAPPLPELRKGRVLRFVESRKPDHFYSDFPKNALGLITRVEKNWVRVLGEGGQYDLRPVLSEPVRKEDAQKYKQSLKAKMAFSTNCNTTTGSDPEVFAVDEDGMVIPAWAYLPSKKQAREYLFAGPRNHLFWDGVQAEFTTNPYTCHQSAVNNIQYGLAHVLKSAIAFNPNARLTHQCVVDCDLEMLQAASEEQSALLCSPSLNAYGERQHLSGVKPLEMPFRFAGCHVHFSIGGAIGPDSAAKYVKAIDKIAGVVSVYLLRGLEDIRRRQYYGQAGEYRLPVHGLEYRTLSSAILVHPAVTHLMFDLARTAFSMANAGQAWAWEAEPSEVQEAINHLNTGLAKEIIDRNRDVLTRMLAIRYANRSNKAIRMIDEGVANLFSQDMTANWNLLGSGSVLFEVSDCVFRS
jgi:hypothetical protein